MPSRWPRSPRHLSCSASGILATRKPSYPRLVASTIRAFDVKRLRRSAQFNPATDYITDKLLDETTDKAIQEAYAERGFIHVPATGSHGGVIATGGVRRDATLSLAALRLLAAGTDNNETLALRRYVLGLSLVAFTATSSTYLRQGCNLVPDIDKPREFTVIHSDGSHEVAESDPCRRAEFCPGGS